MPKMYDEDSLDMVHETNLGLIGSNAAGETVVARFATYMNAKILEVSLIQHGLGTADEAGWTILNGTTSVDALVCGTQAMGTIQRATLTDIDFDAEDVLNIANITSDTTCSAFITVTWQERFDGSS